MWQTVMAAHTSCWMEVFCSAFGSFKSCSSESTLCENDSLVHTVLQSPWHIPQVCISHMLHVQQNMLFSISGLPKRALPGKKSSYVGNNFSSTPTNAVHWRLALLPNLQHYIVTPPLVEFKRDLKAAGKIPAEQIFYLRKGRTWYAVLLFSTDFYS